jgi:hypothetical protein
VSQSRNICCHKEATSITYSECVCSLSNPAYNEHVPYYAVIYGLSDNFIYPHYLRIFDKKKVSKINYVLIFSTNAVPKISHYKKNSTRYYRKYTEIFLQSTRYSRQILKKLEVSRFFSKNTQILNQIRPEAAELFHADGQTDMKLIDAFRNFSKGLKNKRRTTVCNWVPSIHT